MDIAPLRSTQGPLAKSEKPYYKPQGELSDMDMDSDDELPDFWTLVQRVGATKAAVTTQRSNQQAVPRLGQRRGGRKVVHEESDDE